ncbi:MAG: chorismate mutase [Spirochaetales bacterium]|nr:chorismate mutase [Spirochaetales bacterium]
MSVRAVRGAIQIKDNTEKFIDDGVRRLIDEIIEKNEIDVNNVISIIFSQTSDLTAKNPAAALRKDGFNETPLFCTKEPDVIGSMERVVRVLITLDTDRIMEPVYLEGAKNLRQDIKS